MSKEWVLCLALSALTAAPAKAAGEASFNLALFNGDRLIAEARSGAKAWKVGLREDQREQNALFETCAPSVVLLYRIASSDNDLKQKPVGSGFLVESTGLIVTNAHVANELGGYGRVIARFANNAEEAGEVVYIGSEYTNDLAFVQLLGGRKNYPFLTLGDSSSVRTGNVVFALGYPHALQLSFTQGMVNGTRCVKSPFVTNDNCFLQSQVITEPGNSGGPLVDLDGNVIGVNTNIPSPVKGWTGISFAIPVDKVKETLATYRASLPKP